MLTIKVYGMPAPQGSKAFKGFTKKGRAILTEQSKRVKPWRELVWAAGIAARNNADPIDCPVVIHMTFTLPKPQSAPKRKRTYPDRTPDLSKLMRSTEDALVDAGVLKDDARIVSAHIHKVYPNEGDSALECPGCIIHISEIRDGTA
jgi:Holliday junction resolvase RusA-like endonuclease